MIPVRNYVPGLTFSKDAKGVEDEPENPAVILKKTSEVKFEAINRKDLIYHNEHGVLKVKQIESEGDAKSLLCYAYENGKSNRDKEFKLVEADAAQLVGKMAV